MIPVTVTVALELSIAQTKRHITYIPDKEVHRSESPSYSRCPFSSAVRLWVCICRHNILSRRSNTPVCMLSGSFDSTKFLQARFIRTLLPSSGGSLMSLGLS